MINTILAIFDADPGVFDVLVLIAVIGLIIAAVMSTDRANNSVRITGTTVLCAALAVFAFAFLFLTE